MKYFFFLLILSLIVITSGQGFAGNLQDKHANEDVMSGSIIIEGTELTYRVEGTGPSILLVGSNLEYFSMNLRNHFRLYFIDTRYTAKNYTPIDPESYTLETLYKDIDSMRSVLGLDNFIIVGHSIYGVIAYEYAKRYPEYVSHIVMIGTPSTYGTKAHQDAVNDYWETAPIERKELFAVKRKQFEDERDQLTPIETIIKSIVSTGPKRWHNANFDATELVEKYVFNRDFGQHLFSNLLANYNMFPEGDYPKIPVFIAIGKSDYITPITLWIGKYDELPNLTISLFEKSGHTPQYEESELFDMRLIEWIRNN